MAQGCRSNVGWISAFVGETQSAGTDVSPFTVWALVVPSEALSTSPVPRVEVDFLFNSHLLFPELSLCLLSRPNTSHLAIIANSVYTQRVFTFSPTVVSRISEKPDSVAKNRFVETFERVLLCHQLEKISYSLVPSDLESMSLCDSNADIPAGSLVSKLASRKLILPVIDAASGKLAKKGTPSICPICLTPSFSAESCAICTQMTSTKISLFDVTHIDDFYCSEMSSATFRKDPQSILSSILQCFDRETGRPQDRPNVCTLSLSFGIRPDG